METDIFSELGELAIASRMKRLSDRIMKDGIDVYSAYNIDFDPRLFPVYYYLSVNGSASITEISSNLGMSHPAVIKIAKSLEKRKLIVSKASPQDGRKRMLELSAHGRKMLPEIQWAWNDIAGAISKMLDQHRNNLLTAVQEVEDSFNISDFTSRVKQERSDRLLHEVEIVDYQPEYGDHFKEINYDWIGKYFTIEDIDRDYLENHQQKILDAGGAIVFAKYNGEIAGTCALIKYSDDLFELSKMGVYEQFRGKEIGKKLGLAIIEKAKELNCKTLYLDSNKSLTPALNLYRTLGFRNSRVPTDESEYSRCNIRMDMQF